METKIQPFLKDTVDPLADKGEKWKVGEREVSTAKPKSDAEMGITSKPKTPKATKKKTKKVGVYLILRRCPSDVHNAMGTNYRSEREGAAKNGQPEYYFEPEDFEAFIAEKAKWMWLNTENMVVEIDSDPKTVAMYNRAFADDGETGKLKGGETLVLDGHWTEELKDHWMKRYKWLRTEIMKASLKYEQADSYKEEMLRGNL